MTRMSRGQGDPGASTCSISPNSRYTPAMRTQIGKILLVLAWAMALAAPAHAQGSEHEPCKAGWPEPFAAGQPFLLNDPRSGLMLYVESDGRHMAAITREGNILWQRDLFGDPNLERLFVPPPRIEGITNSSAEASEPSAKEWLIKLGIDRIASEPDCEIRRHRSQPACAISWSLHSRGHRHAHLLAHRREDRRHSNGGSKLRARHTRMRPRPSRHGADGVRVLLRLRTAGNNLHLVP